MTFCFLRPIWLEGVRLLGAKLIDSNILGGIYYEQEAEDIGFYYFFNDILPSFG